MLGMIKENFVSSMLVAVVVCIVFCFSGCGRWVHRSDGHEMSREVYIRCMDECKRKNPCEGEAWGRMNSNCYGQDTMCLHDCYEAEGYEFKR